MKAAKLSITSLWLISVCSAATAPAVISTGPNGIGPVGLVATTSEVLYSHPFCQTVTNGRTINNLSGSLFATLPDQIAGSNPDRTCAENYFAISPGLGGFSAGAVYVSAVVNQNPANPSSGTNVILREPGNTLFATLPAGFAPTNHAYVSFDTVGTFGFALIVTGNAGVIGYNSSGGVLFQYINPVSSITYALEGATVAPLSFAACPGCLMVTASIPGSSTGAILVVPPGTPSGSALTVWSTDVPAEPESIQFVPAQACTFNGFQYFVSGYNTPPGLGVNTTTGAVLAYTPAQLASYVGQFLIPDEVTGNIYAYSGPNTRTVFSSTNYQLEGASIVQCGPATGCPATQGFWKHHAFPSSMFDSTGHIQLGTGSYTASQLVDLLNTPPKGGDATLILGHQLIAAIANVNAGAQVTTQAAQAIAQAESLLTSNNLSLTSFVAASSTLGQQMTALADILDNYNSAVGLHCQEGSGLK